MKGYKIFKNNLVHETAIIGNNVEIGEGNIIMPYTVIGQPGFIREIDFNDFHGKIIIGDNNRIGIHCSIMTDVNMNTKIGSNNLIMNKVNIGHGACIGSSCEIGAGTIIPGNTSIGNECRIKIGCIIRNNLRIGEKSFIAMGSVVVNDLSGNDNYMGFPAKPRK